MSTEDHLADHRVLPRSEWIEARRALLLKEKEFTRLRDALSQARRDLPWEPVTKEYVFDGPDGKQTLGELFDGRSQLIVYHFMFGPTWDAGCPHCSHVADSFNGPTIHLPHRDTSFVVVSRAPYAKLAAYRKRMGWGFKWVSSESSDFNFDLGVSFTPDEVDSTQPVYNFGTMEADATEREGASVFFKDASGRIFHTYSTYARGLDMVMVDYQFLDLVPKGRDEGDRGPFWVRRHDSYDK